MRKHTRTVMWLIAALFIAGIFFWYGTGSGNRNTIAVVGDIKIETDEYNRELNRQLKRTRESSEEELDENTINEIRRQVLGTMINRYLMYQQARKLDIVVTDQEVINTIQNLPQFRQNEKFSFRLYRESLRYSLGMTPEEFEKMVRMDIVNRKLERHILSAARVTEKELKLWYISHNGSEKGFEENRKELENELMQRKRTDLYRNWITGLQNSVEIKVYPETAGITG